MPDDSAVEALSANATESFNVSVTDSGGSSATGSVSVSITAVNDAPVNLSINNNTIARNVAYATSDVTSDNLLSNDQFTNYADGWDKTGVCSSANSTSNTCARVSGNEFQTGPNTAQLKQTVDVAKDLNLTDAQIAEGGVLSWSTEVRMNSNFCMGAYTSDGLQ